MHASTTSATEVRCLTENGHYVMIFIDGDVEVGRVALSAVAAANARAALDRAMLLDVKLRSLAAPGVPEIRRVQSATEFPPLDLSEACVVVGAALRRVAPEDSVVGFELFPLESGIFDWSLEDAGPLGGMYDSSVRAALGAQAGNPRGTPMSAPEIDLEGLGRSPRS